MTGIFNPETLVEIVCEGCVSQGERFTNINVRIRKEHKGKRTVQCRRCLHIIEVEVFASRSVTVYQSDKYGANRHETNFEKVWQE